MSNQTKRLMKRGGHRVRQGDWKIVEKVYQPINTITNQPNARKAQPYTVRVRK